MRQRAIPRPQTAEVGTRRQLQVRLGCGFVALTTLAIAAWPGWAEIIQATGIVIIVPLGLRLILCGPTPPGALEVMAWRLMPAAGCVALTTYLLPPGDLLGLCPAFIWWCITVTLALAGLLRFLDRPWPIDHHFLQTAALGFLGVGGTWFLFARAGANPGGYTDAIVKLTGVHFHYAGFALPLVLAEVARRQPQWKQATTGAAVGILLGIPATAIGLTVHGITELIGATFMACAGIAVAVLLAAHAQRETDGERVALLVAAGCLAGGMTLAILYTFGLRYGWNILPLERMVRTHGTLNGFGFGLVALIAFNWQIPAQAANTQEPKAEALNGVA